MCVDCRESPSLDAKSLQESGYIKRVILLPLLTVRSNDPIHLSPISQIQMSFEAVITILIR